MRDKPRDNTSKKGLLAKGKEKPREKEKTRPVEEGRGRFAGRFAGIQRFIRETRSELKKVVWPSRETAVNLTLVVAGVSLAVGIFLGVIDLGFRELFKVLVGG